MGPLAAQADRLQAGVDAIVELQARVEAAGPWAMAPLYGTEAEAHWGPPELLAHLVEMLPFWLGHAERLIDGAAAAGGNGAPVPFGRTADDDIRIGVIGRDREFPLRELVARFRSEGARTARRMRDMTAAEAAAPGVHPRGDYTVEGLLERFITGHVEDHVKQLQDILAERGA